VKIKQYKTKQYKSKLTKISNSIDNLEGVNLWVNCGVTGVPIHWVRSSFAKTLI